MPTDARSCYIWDLPDMCRPCKDALASGQPSYSPAMCYPAATADDIKDLSVRDLLDRQPVGSQRWIGRARSAAVKFGHPPYLSPEGDLPPEPTTPVNSLPPEPEVNEGRLREPEPEIDEDRKGRPREDAEDDWQMIQRLVKDAMSAEAISSGSTHC